MNIEIRQWDYTCGDGCCYEWGADLYIDGEKVDQHFTSDEGALKYVLTDVLNHKVSINYKDISYE